MENNEKLDEKDSNFTANGDEDILGMDSRYNYERTADGILAKPLFMKRDEMEVLMKFGGEEIDSDVISILLTEEGTE